MAWYFSPRDTAHCGLKRVRLAYQMPMPSTGKQKFMVYIYYKIEKYDENDPWSDSDSEVEDGSDEEEEEEDLLEDSVEQEIVMETTKTKNKRNNKQESKSVNIEIQK